jgi:hypothetical protein
MTTELIKITKVTPIGQVFIIEKLRKETCNNETKQSYKLCSNRY